jgi:hypothetical protein
MDGLAKMFTRPGPPLAVAPGRPQFATRYQRNDRETGVYMGQLVAMQRLHKATGHVGRRLVGPEIQQYVDEVLAMPWPRWRSGPTWGAGVRLVPGLNAKTGSAEYRSGVLFLPPEVDEPFVLHELAHHLGAPSDHGPAFVAAYLDLLENVMNRETAQLFQASFAAEGIST